MIKKSTNVPSYFVSLDEGLSIAKNSADEFGLPQTVYKTKATCGWSNTNPFSKILAANGVEKHCSVLPENYFM